MNRNIRKLLIVGNSVKNPTLRLLIKWTLILLMGKNEAISYLQWYGFLYHVVRVDGNHGWLETL